MVCKTEKQLEKAYIPPNLHEDPGWGEKAFPEIKAEKVHWTSDAHSLQILACLSQQRMQKWNY